MRVQGLKYLDRFFVHKLNKPNLSDFQNEKLNDLKKMGYCVIPDLISKDLLAEIQIDVDKRLKNHEYEKPCLAQSLIDEKKPEHKAMKDKYFLSSLEEKFRVGMTFGAKEIIEQSYQDVINRFRPSTLKLDIPKDDDRYCKILFKKELLEIIESYMGVRPYCTEAYVRRNFPCEHKVMNHFWHRDRNNPNYLLKMFVLFSDCSAENGPHQFVEKSHLDYEDVKPYYSENEVKNYCDSKSSKIISSVFKAGTIIIEDTRGLHRSAVPTIGFRDLGFAVFVPTSFWSKSKMNFYKIDKRVYHSLTRYQRSFIPTGVVLE